MATSNEASLTQQPSSSSFLTLRGTHSFEPNGKKEQELAAEDSDLKLGMAQFLMSVPEGEVCRIT